VLLGARKFRLGAGTERVARNLHKHGGEIAADAVAWIGQARPPSDSPSVALGEFAGTLGPRSFGFLNNVGRIAALDAPLPELPRQGGLGLVVSRRDALPEIGPLAVARGLGVSWIVSVGDGDPAEALAFLSADVATAALAVVLGDGADGASLRTVLGAKPAVVWGGDELCRAVVRRSGAVAAASLDEWLARAALLDAGLEAGGDISIVVVGGGSSFVESEVKRAGLTAPISQVEDWSEISADGPIVVVASTLPTADRKYIHADLRHPEHLRALLHALASPVIEPGGGRVPARVDKELAQKVRGEVDAALGDHDAKRLLKAWGAKVTRQAPTPTPTRAVNLAQQIGLPVELAIADEMRTVESAAEVRRIAALLLPKATLEQPLMVREHFPDHPRARVKVALERGLGLVLRVGEACGLAPLTRIDAQALAAATPARRAADQKGVAELLTRIAACAHGEQATFELELFVGSEPTVLKASGALKR
jgi:acyl-CoA synthetase (NDP forming)